MIDVTVVGSLHLDIMVEAPRLPHSDETLMGSAWRTKCGGKGGNQAVAAARFGAVTAMGGRTGGDEFGERLKANLSAAAVDTGCVDLDPGLGSGMSVAIAQADGEYGAVVVSGANLGIDATAIATAWLSLWPCRVLLLQSEIPEAVNIAAARAAKGQGARVVLNAAPARPVAPELLSLLDVLVVNRGEAAMLSGLSSAADAAHALRRPALDVIVTLGRDGLVIAGHDGSYTASAALPVKALASHGAGDCFCGALAARLARGENLDTAVNFARVAAGLFVSMPEAMQPRLDAAQVLERLASGR